MTLKRALVSALALTLVVAGCGSSKSSSPPAATATTSAPPATTTTAKVASAASTAVAAGVAAFASNKNCAQLAEAGTKVGQAMAAAGQSKDLNTIIKADEQGFDTLASNAPSAIKGDVQTIATAFTSFANALQKSGYKLGAVPNAGQIAALSVASHSFASQNVKTAELHLQAWAQKNCTKR